MKKYLEIFGVMAVVTAIGFLGWRVYLLESRLAGFSKQTQTGVQEPVGGKGEASVEGVDVCGEECRRLINETVAEAMATLSGTTKTAIPPSTPVPAERQTTYIPLSGPITTTSMDWVDAAGTDVYIDLVNDYGKNTWVSWEAFLKIADGNGQAFARLYDATHGIAVNGSEVSVTKGVSTQVISGELKFWAGRNLYRVQLKSLNSFVATLESGRIKINY